jgi:hypothetical protein
LRQRQEEVWQELEAMGGTLKPRASAEERGVEEERGAVADQITRDAHSRRGAEFLGTAATIAAGAAEGGGAAAGPDSDDGCESDLEAEVLSPFGGGGAPEEPVLLEEPLGELRSAEQMLVAMGATPVTRANR